jgi:hypothetical protein
VLTKYEMSCKSEINTMQKYEEMKWLLVLNVAEKENDKGIPFMWSYRA